MNGHDFGHEFVSESVSEADSDTDTRFFDTSDTDSDMDMGRVMTSDTDTTSDTGMSENLGHGLGHGQTSDTRVRSSLPSVRMKLNSQYNPKNLFRSEICVDNFSPN